MRLPDGGAVTGWASCRWQGAAYFEGTDTDGSLLPVPFAIGPQSNIRADSAVSLSRERLDPGDVRMLRGVRCTVVTRALFDETRRARTLRDAVVAIDMMAAAELVSVARMRAYVARRNGWTGVALVRRALDLAGDASRSPNETRLRLVWQLDAGLPRPLVNVPVFDRDRRLLGIPDLLDPDAGLIGEFDGAMHRSATRHSRDVDREAGFRDHLLEVYRVTGLDLGRPGLVDRLLSAHGRARFLDEAQRPWTLTPPARWSARPSLDAMLDDRDATCDLYRRWAEEPDPDIRDIRGW